MRSRCGIDGSTAFEDDRSGADTAVCGFYGCGVAPRSLVEAAQHTRRTAVSDHEHLRRDARRGVGDPVFADIGGLVLPDDRTRGALEGIDGRCGIFIAVGVGGPVDRTVGIHRRIGDLLRQEDLVLRGGIVLPDHLTGGIQRHEHTVARHGIDVSQVAHRDDIGRTERIGRSDLLAPQHGELRDITLADVDRLGDAALAAAVVGDGERHAEHALGGEGIGGACGRGGRAVGEGPLARDDLAVGIGRLVGEGHLVADVDHHRSIGEVGRRQHVVGQHGHDLLDGGTVAVGTPGREGHRVLAGLLVDHRIGLRLFRPVAFARESEVPEVVRNGRTLDDGGIGEGHRRGPGHDLAVGDGEIGGDDRIIYVVHIVVAVRTGTRCEKQHDAQ